MSRTAQNISAKVVHHSNFVYSATSQDDDVELRVHRSASHTHCSAKVATSSGQRFVDTTESPFGDGPKRSSSGIFSLFKWFKKVPADNKRKSNANNNVDSSDSDSDKDELREVRLGVDSPTYPLSRNQSTGSVDTLFSTATVASFTYVPPSTYRPYGGANAPEKFIAPSPDTDTHKRRMKQLEKHRERDKNLTLRKKYKLFSTETVNKSLDSAVPKNKNNKNTCDNLNVDSHVYSELSLPLMKSKTKIMENGNTNGEIVEKNKKHRRTVSDSSKDKKAGAYCHVKGKRKAPQPPSEQNSNDTPKGTLKSPNSTLGRRQKRQAPRPPETRDEQNNFQNIRSTDSKITTELCNRNSNISVSKKHSSIFATSIGYSDDSPENPSSNLTEEQKSLLITNISKLQLSSNRQSVMESSSDYQSVVNDAVPDVVCNDSLKLVHGYLKPVKESAKMIKTDADDTAQQKPVAPVSPISPRPWYKRTLSGNRDSIGSSSHLKRELLFKHSKSEESEDFLPLRFSGLRDSKLSSVFSRLSSSSSSSDDKKRDSEYRKSGISILTNISELDREAALIVQKEQFREQAKRKAENEAYYSPSNSQTDVPTFLNYEEQETEESSKNLFKKGSARELISKFNALTSATKITVNSALFAARESECAVNKNTKRFSCAAPDRESDRRPSELITPPMKRSIFNMKGIGDEFSSSKSAEIEMTFEPKISNLSMDINKYFEAPKPNAPPLTPLEETSKTVVSPPSASADVKLVEPIFIGWECTRCTLKNARTEIKCTACGMWKPFSKINIEKYLAPAPAQTETGIVKSTADINNCIKKSVPDASPKSVHNKTNSVDKNIKSDQSPDKKIYITETVLTETVFGNEQNIENETKKARTFAENVFKQLEMDEKYEEPTETAISTSVVVLQAEPTLEELRKARVARFSQDIESQMNKNNSPCVNSASIDQPNTIEETRTSKVDTNNKADYKNEIVPSKIMTEEQQKLRKMLKEMKDSLPKKRKSVPDLSKKIDAEEVIKEDIELYIDESDRNEEKVSINKGAIPKTVKDETKPIIVQEILKDKKEKVVEAYVITKETRYENIKVRRDNAEAKKPIKVSAGSQTQSKMMPKVIDSKPPAGRGAFLPLTVEELSSPSSGTASISRKSSFGKGTFELIRAKDFAGITTNISSSSSSATPESSQSHTYANIPTVIEQTVGSAPNIDVSSPTGSSGAPEMPSSSSMQSISSSVFSEEEILSAKLSDPEGLKDFKATLKTDKHNANTLAINRLLRRLEAAIAGGQHIQAAKLAKDLARMKVNCSVTRQKSLTTTSLDVISVDMYVEDRVSHQGPIPLQITPKMTVSELKQKVAQEFEIPSHVQRWILDKQLATDDEGTVEEYNVNFNGCPIFLYLVAPDGEFDETLKKASVKLKQKTLENANNEPVAGTSKQYNDDVLNLSINESDSDITEEDEEEVPKLYPDLNAVNIEPELDLTNAWRCPVCTLVNSIERPGCEACSTERPRSAEPNYQKLMDLDNTDLVPNREPFECLICLTMCKIGEGVILRECLHVFCRECLAHTIEYNEEAEVKCPYRDNKYSCDISLQEREVKALVPQQVFEQHLAKSVAQAENKIDNAFHCKTPDCPGWCIFEDNVNEFRCPVCKVMNCLTCQVIHEGLNCKQYQEQMNQESETNIEARRTRDMLEEMVNRGEAMVCPTCEVVLMKKWGCDWLRCSMCKTEICWVTRGPRWGPAGKGDVSGGCKCGVNGIKCHPKCTYCH